MSLTTQAAERAYRASRMKPGTSHPAVVEGGCCTGCRRNSSFTTAARSNDLRIDLAADARLLMVEPVVFGRSAMGERLTRRAVSATGSRSPARAAHFTVTRCLEYDRRATGPPGLSRSGCGAMASASMSSAPRRMPDAQGAAGPGARRTSGRMGGASLLRP